MMQFPKILTLVAQNVTADVADMPAARVVKRVERWRQTMDRMHWAGATAAAQVAMTTMELDTQMTEASLSPNDEIWSEQMLAAAALYARLVCTRYVREKEGYFDLLGWQEKALDPTTGPTLLVQRCRTKHMRNPDTLTISKMRKGAENEYILDVRTANYNYDTVRHTQCRGKIVTVSTLDEAKEQAVALWNEYAQSVKDDPNQEVAINFIFPFL